MCNCNSFSPKRTWHNPLFRKNSISLVSKIFSRPKALLSAAGNTLVYGWILFNNSKIDEVMLSVYRAPKSFTGEEMIEISCHGGVGVVSEIFQILLKSGFRQAERENSLSARSSTEKPI